MPRRGRLHLPGGCYHVVGRGLERRRIFNQAEDKEDFLRRLETGLADAGAECLGWALMSNHYHLLIRVGERPLSELMGPLLGGYAGSYNRRKGRSGYVFQNRYKSILCDADAYLLELVRYIHLNPLRAGMLQTLSQLDRYPWTGHAAILGKQSKAWQSVDEVLRLFAKRVGVARQRYRDFMRAGLPHSPDLAVADWLEAMAVGKILSLRKKNTNSASGTSGFWEKATLLNRPSS